jgi:hypothetical protein
MYCVIDQRGTAINLSHEASFQSFNRIAHTSRHALPQPQGSLIYIKVRVVLCCPLTRAPDRCVRHWRFGSWVKRRSPLAQELPLLPSAGQEALSPPLYDGASSAILSLTERNVLGIKAVASMTSLMSSCACHDPSGDCVQGSQALIISSASD